MSKELKLPLNEMLKEQERIAIKAIVVTAKSTITDTGTNLKATLESDAQDLKNYASTYNANITDGLEGQSAQAVSDFLTQLPKPELDNPVN
ncbi:TPA: hypothetical protein ACJSWF_001577 [Streptococcus agalactiae]